MTPLELWAEITKRFRPPPLEPLSSWLEANIRLPQGLAAEGGPIRLWPTQKGIADALGDPTICAVIGIRQMHVLV